MKSHHFSIYKGCFKQISLKDNQRLKFSSHCAEGCYWEMPAHQWTFPTSLVCHGNRGTGPTSGVSRMKVQCLAAKAVKKGGGLFHPLHPLHPLLTSLWIKFKGNPCLWRRTEPKIKETRVFKCGKLCANQEHQIWILCERKINIFLIHWDFDPIHNSR